jgi:molybdate transport system substrate-binding protein
MKKLTSLLLAFLMVFAMTACSGSSGSSATGSTSQTATDTTKTAATGSSTETTSTASSQPVELTIFAASSMTETLNQIAEKYKEVAPNVTLTFDFDSSGTLKTQIQEGADCDIFISAAQKQMNQLDITADASINTDGLDFVLSDTRINLVQNKVVLVVPEGNPAGIQSFDDVGTDKVKLIALGNSDVPVGQYAQEMFTTMGIWDKLNADSKITFGTNVKEVTSQVSADAVDCGVVYATDAKAAGLTVVAEASADSHKPVIYPAAVMKSSKNVDAAQAFLDYLKTDDCTAVFEAAGFTIPN